MPIQWLTTPDSRAFAPSVLEVFASLQNERNWTPQSLVWTPDAISKKDVLSLLSPFFSPFESGHSVYSFQEWIASQGKIQDPSFHSSPDWLQEIFFRDFVRDFFGKQKVFSFQEESSLFFLFKLFRKEGWNSERVRYGLNLTNFPHSSLLPSLFQKYQDEIQKNFILRDLSSVKEQLFEKICKKDPFLFKGIQKIYWIGFSFLEETELKWIEGISQSYPEIEQIILVQVADQKEPDLPFLSSLNLGSSWNHLKSSKSETALSGKIFLTPFDEAASIFLEIQQKIKEGLSPSELSVFLPEELFWRNYFANEFYKMGIFRFPFFSVSLCSSRDVKETFSDTTEKSVDRCYQLIQKVQSEFEAEPSIDRSVAIQLLSKWHDTLQETLFYESSLLKEKLRKEQIEKIAKRTIYSFGLDTESVQIRSFYQSGLKRFHSAFIFGMQQSCFPQTPQRWMNLLLPEPEKKLINQKLIFQHLVQAGKEVFLSCSSIDSQGKEIAPSPFLEEWNISPLLETKRVFFYGSKADTSLLLEKAKIEEERYQALASEFEGKILNEKTLHLLHEKFSKHFFSPRELEEYRQCPFRFFASSLLRLKKSDEKKEEGSPIDRGVWAHYFLEKFFIEEREELILSLSSKEIRPLLLKKMEKAVESLSDQFLKQRNWINSLLWQKILMETQRFATAVMKEFWERMEKLENPFFPFLFEQSFGGEEAPLFLENKKGERIAFKGRIDRIDLSSDKKRFLVIDYKTGELGSVSKSILEGKSFQLPLYMLATEKILSKFFEGEKEKGGLFLDLKELKLNQGFLTKKTGLEIGISSRSSGLIKEEEWEAYWAHFDEKIFSIYEQMRNGDFSLRPDPCDPFCDFQTICRYHDKLSSHS